MLKAVFIDFNGVILNDEAIHRELVDELLLTENLRPMSDEEYQTYCLGRSDRAGLQDLFGHRERRLSPEALQRLVDRKARAYRQRILTLDPLPIYADVKPFLDRAALQRLPLGLVTGAVRSEVEYILEQTNLRDYFQVIVTGEDTLASKPQPDGYLLALRQLNACLKETVTRSETLPILPQDCLAIEDSFAGIQAARSAGMSVVGIAHTYPYHFMQRLAHWAVDRFSELDLDRVTVVLSRRLPAET